MNLTPNLDAALTLPVALLVAMLVVIFPIAMMLAIVSQNRRGRIVAQTNRKELRRMSYQGSDVTVIRKGPKKTKIRNQWGFLVDVPSKELTEIEDEERRVVLVAVDNEKG